MRFIRDLRKWLFILAAIALMVTTLFNDAVWVRQLTGRLRPGCCRTAICT